MTADELVKQLGPLAALAGRWEGAEGVDVSPSRSGPVETRFREELVLDPMGPVENGPQLLYGLRYATTAWPLGAADPFHEEVGYWLWDRGNEQVMRCFIVPRGVSVLAGGNAAADAREFSMHAELGSPTFGIASNPFLDRAFKTLRYELRVVVHDDGSFSYDEDTVLQIAGVPDPFHHTDRNRLAR